MPVTTTCEIEIPTSLDASYDLVFHAGTVTGGWRLIDAYKQGNYMLKWQQGEREILLQTDVPAIITAVLSSTPTGHTRVQITVEAIHALFDPLGNIKKPCQKLLNAIKLLIQIRLTDK